MIGELIDGQISEPKEPGPWSSVVGRQRWQRCVMKLREPLGHEDGGHVTARGVPASSCLKVFCGAFFCCCGMSVMSGMLTLMPGGPSLLAAPDKAAEQRQFPRVSLLLSITGPVGLLY